MGASFSVSKEAPAAAAEPLALETLTFVNRGAEVLDVLVPNLMNQERLSTGLKMVTPLAAQPQGTGKTALGRNICTVLRRSRETAHDNEEIVARRMAAAWTWTEIEGRDRPNLLRDARSDVGSDNLLMRVLLRRFPRQAPLLRALQKGSPLVVQMRDLRSSDASLVAALGFAMYEAHTGSSSMSEFAEFVRKHELPSGCAVDVAIAIGGWVVV